MAKGYKYFNRDISWLSYNRLVLESAEAEDISVGEMLNYISFHSSNLDEFYGVRVAEYRKAAYGTSHVEEVSNPAAMIQRINLNVSSQMLEASEIVATTVCDRLLAQGTKLHFDTRPTHPTHVNFMRNYFEREIIPNIQPVLLGKGTLVFLRDNRPYFAVKLFSKSKLKSGKKEGLRADYSIVRLPINKELPRFVTLPDVGDGLRHIVFLDDIIRANIHELYPGYVVDGEWSIKVCRDANLQIDEDESPNLAEAIRDNLTLRKTGAPSGFYHDKDIPHDVLQCLKKTFAFAESEMVCCGRYINLHDVASLPADKGAPSISGMQIIPRRLQICASLLDAVRESDIMLHYPYEPFDYVIRLLNEAAHDPKVTQIKITQYRVATNSAVVDSLIAAAAAGKHVTVFVELKARFDERNNLEMSDKMKAAGITIIYSIPGLKVHAKVALIIRGEGGSQSVAYISTGNFNERTARLYTDHGLFTSNAAVIDDLRQLFTYLEVRHRSRATGSGDTKDTPIMPAPILRKLLVSQFNMDQALHGLIMREKEIAQNGGEAYIALKMNGLQYRPYIDDLYEASLAGVKIDLIVRGICCLVPEQEYSENIHLTRLVDTYLEHGRVWMFGPNGERGMYITSSDWQNRNVKRRIEVATPIENAALRQELKRILEIQLADNSKAHIIDKSLNNISKHRAQDEPQIRAQRDIYTLLLNNQL